MQIGMLTVLPYTWVLSVLIKTYMKITEKGNTFKTNANRSVFTPLQDIL